MQHGRYASRHDLLSLLEIQDPSPWARRCHVVGTKALNAAHKELGNQGHELGQEWRVLRAPIGRAGHGAHGFCVDVEARELPQGVQRMFPQEPNNEPVRGLEEHSDRLQDFPAQSLVLHCEFLEGRRQLFDSLFLHVWKLRQRVHRQAVAPKCNHLPHLGVVLHAEQTDVPVLFEQRLQCLSRLVQHRRRRLCRGFDACGDGVYDLCQHVHEASLRQEQGRSPGVKYVGLFPNRRLRRGPVGQHMNADVEAIQDVGPTFCG
mmetsp:Transcript_80576/g.224193  ORF Transcript_80576/g.224193 Transcript_80576/m.224193 type:complete len:261 (-) Transcript_80576:1569-2351(-)